MERRLSIVPQRFSLKVGGLFAAVLLPLGVVTAAPAQASTVYVWVDMGVTCPNSQYRWGQATGATIPWASYWSERGILYNVPYGYTSSTLRFRVQVDTKYPNGWPATFDKICELGSYPYTITSRRSYTVTVKPLSGHVYSI